MILPLFAYGTLRDPEYQRELFGQNYPTHPAHITGFVVLGTTGGYLAATPQVDATISGALVEFDAAAYLIADAWEDLAVYQRIPVAAQRSSSAHAQRCFIYVQSGAHGQPITDGRLTNRSRADVLDDIRRFRAAFGN